MAKAITFLRAHKRAIVLSLIFAYTVFLLIYPDEFGRFYAVFFGAINVALIASQVFWTRRVRELGKRLIPGKRWRWGLGVAGLMVSGLTLRAALLEAPFQLWLLGSRLGFLIAMLLGTVDRFARLFSWAFKKVTPPTPELRSPGRRRFLEQTAVALSAAPFVAGTGFSMAVFTSKPCNSGSGSGACRRPSKVSALCSCPISTSAPS
jgi:hypothetical protein